MAEVCKDSVELEEGEIQEQGEEDGTNKKQNREKSKRKSRKEKRRKENDEEGNESKRIKTENERHQHKKGETQNDDKVQYEMRNDKEHRDRKRDGKDRGQHHTKDKTTSNLPNDLTVPIRRLLCSSGGSMELWKIADAMVLTLEQIERFVEYEEGRSIMLRKEGNSRLAVSRSAVRLCTEGSQKCNGDCEKLHLCRYFLMGKCNRHPCAFSHNIHDHHNMKVLNLYELQELDTDEIRQLLIQNDPSFLPKVCKKYNKGPVTYPFGNCAFKIDCQKLHVCQFFLSGNCKFMGKCKRSHSFTSFGTPEKLEKWGLSNELLPKLRDIYRNACALGDCCTSLPKKKYPTCVEKDLKDLPPDSMKDQPFNLQENVGNFISTCRSVTEIDTYQENQHISEQIKCLREDEIPSVRYPSMDTYGEELNDDMPIQESYKNGNRVAKFKRRDMEESNMSYKSRRLQKEAENYEIRKRNTYQENQHISERIKCLREDEIPSVRYPSMDTYGEELNDDMPIQESYKNGNRIAEFKRRDMEESNMSYKSRRLQKEAENYEIRKRSI
uniref:C3H1-type domain-containing protein n=1 Tax=Leptobrachium leishanense TaxID=445787 RepID=A0A8C5R3P8_9ANUR